MTSDSSQHEDETRPTVFVVDDDPDARQALCSVVTAMGLAVQPFASAEAFLDSEALSQHGCLVTDLQMPGLDGLELQHRLVATGSTLPVIVVSGHADVPIVVQAMSHGAVTLLQKPYEIDELGTAIRTAIARSTKARQDRMQRRALETTILSLTAGEKQVLKCMLKGQRNKAIALELDISQRTVERRRHSIFKNFGTTSIVELSRLLKSVHDADWLPTP